MPGLLERLAERRRKIARRVLEEAVEKQMGGVFVACATREILDGVATDHQAPMSAVDIGQGSTTVLLQIAAEVLLLNIFAGTAADDTM